MLKKMKTKKRRNQRKRKRRNRNLRGRRNLRKTIIWTNCEVYIKINLSILLISFNFIMKNCKISYNKY